MKRLTTNRWFRILLVLAFVCLAIYFVFSHAVPTDKLDQVSRGMTRAQVIDLLGQPQRTLHDPPRDTVFFYGGFQRLQFCTVEVSFGSNGRVAGVFHDH